MASDTNPSDWRRSLESRFSLSLRRFFQRRTRNATEAQDLTQEVFVRILSQNETRSVNNPEAYVFTAASNLLRERGRRAHVRGIAYAGAVDSDLCEFLRSGSEDFTPERIVAGKEAIELIIAGMAELGERTRSIFILHRIEGMKQKDIASSLGISVSAVEKHLGKALAYLAKYRADDSSSGSGVA